MINVYWANFSRPTIHDQHTTDRDLLTIEPTNLHSDFMETYKVKGVNKNYFSCPAALDELKRTFVVRSDVDYKLNYDSKDDAIFTDDYDQEFLNKNVVHQERVLQRMFSFIFIADKSVEMTQLPPYMHDYDTSKARLLTGTYNPGKWTRPVNPAYLLTKDTTINIKRNDPLFYVRFNTSEKVNLIPFVCDKEISDIAYCCIHSVRFKGLSSTQDITRLYNIYQQKKVHKRLLKAIQKKVIV